jgi:hypothetical protein
MQTKLAYKLIIGLFFEDELRFWIYNCNELLNNCSKLEL